MKDFLIKLTNIFLSTFGLKVTRKMVAFKNSYSLPYISVDNTRTNLLEIVSKEIRDNNIEGAVAELGVYKGEFAKCINFLFPDKELYLFDTFSGFDVKDIEIELREKYSDGTQDFSDTSISLVISKMKNPSNCKILKGFFPDTTKELKEDIEFSFVSIDTDLYEPIYNGLKYFYPRLVRGGYIFVHDYNNFKYPGAKKAVIDFCRETSIPYLPVPDGWGSVVIMK